MKKLLLIALFSVFAVGCADDNDDDTPGNVQEALEERDLQDKNFISNCSTTPLEAILTGIMTGGDAAIKAARVQYRFEGNNVVRTTFLFSEADCTSDVAIQFRETGEFNVDTDRRTADGGKFIDFDYSNVLAQVLSQAGQEVANSVSLCGSNAWVAGAAEADVTAKSSEATCYGAAVPRHNANIYRVDANVLYLGTATKDSVDDASRPAQLDTNVKYTVQ